MRHMTGSGVCLADLCNEFVYFLRGFNMLDVSEEYGFAVFIA